MSQILIYTFNARFNTSYKLLRSLELPVDKAYIWGSTHIPKQMIRNILAGNYSHILGLGDYRRNAKAMRIETCFINQFGKQQIRDGGAEVLHSNWQLPQLPGTMISQTTSNGPCNYSAYTLLTLIAEYGLSSHLGFIHVPRKFEEQAGLELVSDLTLATS